MAQRVDVDYLVVGAGAAGMAFTDALVDHADVRVALVDRRHGVGGHWQEAYPFVRLHQASTFYGVASTVLGGRRQLRGPEAGLHERADQPTILSYYARVTERLRATDRVEVFTGCEHLGGRSFVSRVSGRRFEAREGCRVVDARYLAPEIPAERPPRFEVGDGARVVAVNDLVRVEEAPGRYVVVGSGKTATDAVVWLLQHDVDPDAICWVRPREPWMLDRAVVQPDPAVFLGLAAELVEAAASAPSLDRLLLHLEDAGMMLRIDRSRTPTMAKAPTLARWEVELLRSVEDVVHGARLTSVRPGRLELTSGAVSVPADTLVVDCAADGLRRPARLPIWGPEAITPQPIRAGFPCFGAALTGYVEATRDDDAVKNALCPPSSYGNSLTEWADMNARGMRNAAAFGAEPDIADWASRTALNPARIAPDHPGSAALDAVRERLAAHSPAGLVGLERLAAS